MTRVDVALYGQPTPLLRVELDDRVAAALDPVTCSLLRPEVRRGSQCWVIGARGGSIADWLVDQAGRGGEVLATDRDTSRLVPHDRLMVVEHDLAREPPPAGPFDLIHARLALAGLPRPDDILQRLTEVMSPDSALVIEELDPYWEHCVLRAPNPEADDLFGAYQHALVTALRRVGTDPGWGRRAYQVLAETGGLTSLQVGWHSEVWYGGEAGCLLLHEYTRVLRHQLIEAGMHEQQLDQLMALLLDPRLEIRSIPVVQTVARRDRRAMFCSPPAPGGRRTG